MTLEDITDRRDLVIRASNLIDDGVEIVPDGNRGYGLRATMDFKQGVNVVRYGGEKAAKNATGPYMAQVSNDNPIDGAYGFLLQEKARWMNEYDKTRSVVNVELARWWCRALRDIKAGEFLYTDYGEGGYDRSGYEPKKRVKFIDLVDDTDNDYARIYNCIVCSRPSKLKCSKCLGVYCSSKCQINCKC